MSRTKSRKTLLQILFKDEFHSYDKKEKHLKDSCFFLEKENLNEKDRIFVLDILKGLGHHKQVIDGTIKQYAKNWKQERISLVDLNIMRISIFEILFDPAIPDNVALNEALELAKKFGEKKSVSFINGILDQILKNKKQILNEKIQ